MSQQSEKWVIESFREDGSKFRPSDWVERICALNAIYGADHRLRYASALKPVIYKGEKCLLVEQALKEGNPGLYEYILGFAKENSLRMQQYSEGYDEVAA